MSIFTQKLPLKQMAYWCHISKRAKDMLSSVLAIVAATGTQCSPKLRYAVPELFIFHALTLGICQTSCGYSFDFEMQIAPLSGSRINLHRIVSVKSLSLWLNWDASATACNQLPPNLGPNRRVAVGE